MPGGAGEGALRGVIQVYEKIPFAGLLLLLICVHPAWSAAGEPTRAPESQERIRQAAARFARDLAASEYGPTARVEVGRLDARLRLARCDREPEAFLPPGARLRSGATVGVRCAGPRPWTLYLPVRVRARVPVLVALRALPRGTELAAGDLAVEQREMSGLTDAYMDRVEDAVGMVLRRDLRRGDPLHPRDLRPARLVRRGERVILVSRGRSIQVRMRGKALEDGARGDHVRVRNLSSDRVVEGRVVAPGTVEVGS